MQIARSQREQVLFVEFRRRRAKVRDVEPVNQLVHRRAELNRLAGPQTRHQRQQGKGFNPAFAQIAQGQRAQTFRQGLTLRTGQQRMVRERRHIAAQRADDLDLGRGVRHVVRTAHNIGHAHLGVIDNRGQRIQELPVATDQNGVGHACRVDRDIAKDTVGPFDALMVQLEAPMALTAFGAQGVFFGLRQVQRGAVIDRRLAHVQLFLALEVQFGRGLETLIETTDLTQFLRGVLIALQAFGLTLDAVPFDAQPFQILLDPVDIFLLGAFRIGVVQTQDERAPRLAGDQVVEQCRAQVPDVQVTGRRRGKTGNGGHGKASLSWRRAVS